jgi:transposase
MNFATKPAYTRIFVWLIWFIALCAFGLPGVTTTAPADAPLIGIISHNPQDGFLFPWQPRYRWKQWALRKYQRWQQAYRHARRSAQLARLATRGFLTMAQVVEWLTARQMRYQLGALPILHALLRTLQVDQIINRHCPSKATIDHGTVAMVMILNRLMFPLPLYRLADWVGRTTLVSTLGLTATQLNDDRLGRTLDALYPHIQAIWQDIVEVALTKAEIDLSLIFYDLTAFITHGRYAKSEWVDFGFAHNTPMNKRKIKVGLDVTADGGLPWLYTLWSGRTLDQATVIHNMETMTRWLQRHGQPLAKTLVVGDRAMLSGEIAQAYDQRGLRYLAGLRCIQKEHQRLVRRPPEAKFLELPLVEGDAPDYWGYGCTVTLKHKEQTVSHKGLVVLAGPIRDQLRQARQEHLDALKQNLAQLEAKIGQPRLRTVKAVQRRVNSCLRNSPVGRLLQITVFTTADGQIKLQWSLNACAWRQAERKDGRYLLVTNDWSLSYQEMFRLYRQKDQVEKQFHVCKGDLQVSPIYLHQDQRIAAMLFLNMVALLAYTLLERQIRQQGVQMTTRQLLEKLENLSVIETHCHDGSCLRRLTPIEPALAAILQRVGVALTELAQGPVAVGPEQPLLTTAILTTPTLELLPPPQRC